MPTKTLAVAVPETLLKQIRGRARRAKRTVEAEVIQLLTEAVSSEGAPDGKFSERLNGAAGLPGNSSKPNSPRSERAYEQDWKNAVADVPKLDDRGLRKAVKPIITAKQAKRLAELNYKAQDEGLTEAEKVEQRELLHIADKSMVVRAAVLSELHKRGVDVSEFVAP